MSTSLRKTVVADYQEAVKLIEMPHELRRALKANDRVPGFLVKLEKELAKVHPKLLNRLTIKTTVYDMTTLFVKGVLAKRDFEHASKLEQIRRQNVLDTKQELSDQADAINRGEEVDLGDGVKLQAKDVGTPNGIEEATKG
jgi:hypothetical protein